MNNTRRKALAKLLPDIERIKADIVHSFSIQRNA